MPFTNVDNLKKMKENVKKNEFPKIAGYKINLPFGAAWGALLLNFENKCGKIKDNRGIWTWRKAGTRGSYAGLRKYTILQGRDRT